MTDMTEADRKAFEHWWHYESGDGEAIDITGQAWQAALGISKTGPAWVCAPKLCASQS